VRGFSRARERRVAQHAHAADPVACDQHARHGVDSRPPIRSHHLSFTTTISGRNRRATTCSRQPGCIASVSASSSSERIGTDVIGSKVLSRRESHARRRASQRGYAGKGRAERPIPSANSRRGNRQAVEREIQTRRAHRLHVERRRRSVALTSFGLTARNHFPLGQLLDALVLDDAHAGRQRLLAEGASTSTCQPPST